MLNGVNDEDQHAHQLGKLLETFDVVCHSSYCISRYPNKLAPIQQALILHSLHICLSKQVVNLIPFNPIGSISQFRSSSDVKVSNFQKVLRGTYNIRTTVRKQMGQDISGACGQLVVNLPNKRSSVNVELLTDIEDIHL